MRWTRSGRSDVRALLHVVLLAGLVASAEARAADLRVRMDKASFVPARAMVRAGTRIVWTNADDMPHSVTADDKRFDSGAIAPGATFTWTAEKPGRIAYHCIFHPSMTAVLVVQPPQK